MYVFDSMKCDICNKPVEVTFLGKIKGTRIKKKMVCSACQKTLNKEDLEKLDL
tara:strand:+ start:354 stop:512 length:159 start_codon:yes stop_codon:yes gene_type:complete